MLSKQGFDLWANDYDQTVQISEDNNLYPFAGYKEILNLIFNEAMQVERSRILDIGFGTGTLASKLYDHHHTIDGIDFSSEMIAISQPKMPQADLVQWDISKGMPAALAHNKYDTIISTYALHHLEDEEKVVFIQELLPLLAEGGKIQIGDIAFGTRAQLEKCKADSIAYWDADEFYFVFDEIKEALKDICSCEFHAVSHCGGVITLSK